MPDVATLPLIAKAFGCSIDMLLGYAVEHRIISDYENRYGRKEYYWGVKPSEMCFEVMKLMPPTRALRVLDIGCGEGKDAVFSPKTATRSPRLTLHSQVSTRQKGLLSSTALR